MKDGPSPTDRRAYRLVARREFVERARDRSFLISTSITLLILVGFIVGNAVFNKGTAFDLGLVGPASSSPGHDVVAAGRAQGVRVTLHQFASASSANGALEKGTIEAALIDGVQIEVKAQPPDQLVGLIQAAAQAERARGALKQAGLSPDEIDQVLAPPPLPVRSLSPVDPHRSANSTVAFVGVLLLYGQLFGFGFAVASGVVEEKASRVVELLLATIRPSELLRGKILGIGALGLAQLLFIGTVGLVVAKAAGTLEFPAGALGTAGLVVLWFVLGFAFYSSLFAVAGALVPRQEELQNTLTPLSLVILGSFFVSITALDNPASGLARVASLLPPSAPLVMPPRLILGRASLWEAGLAVAISLAATAALIPFAARLYSGAVLRTRRVKIREAWRRAARSRVVDG
jgi:ABC-2 type transport system permease protein